MYMLIAPISSVPSKASLLIAYQGCLMLLKVTYYFTLTSKTRLIIGHIVNLQMATGETSKTFNSRQGLFGIPSD